MHSVEFRRGIHERSRLPTGGALIQHGVSSGATGLNPELVGLDLGSRPTMVVDGEIVRGSRLDAEP